MQTQQIREHMKVVGSDGQLVGEVDHVDGDRIKLTKNGPQANGKHHYIPGDWVESVDGEEVCLSMEAKEACQQWLDS